MKKQEKVSFIIKTLQDLFPNPEIPLFHKDPYTLLIAVLLSAQCTDKKVNEVTPKLFAVADTPNKMIEQPVSEIQQIIRPIGLSSTKARHIWQLSKMLIEKFDSKVPDILEDLKTLPGVGQKTASVILAQSFQIPAFPVDTHIHRLAKRWKLSASKTVEQTEKDLKRLFPKELWNNLHLQIIYFGRTYCPARGHIIEKCPICSKIFA